MDDHRTDMTGALARFISNLDLVSVPAKVQSEARRLLLDSIGCMLLAARTCIAPVSVQMAEFLGAGDVATIIGCDRRGSTAGALYANGRLANCMDLDETFPVGHHFGGATVAAALALAEEQNASGAEFLQAVIAGYELGGRVASACGAHMFGAIGRLYHFSVSTAFAGAGVAIRLGLQDEALARQTLGIAGSNTPLPNMWPGKSTELPHSKYQDAGWAVLAGVFAARSATFGATGLSAIFDDQPGLIRMCGTHHFDSDLLVGDLGARWMLSDITYKPWPTCRWMHHPLTALLEAIDSADVDPAGVERVVIATNVLLSGARFANTRPVTWVSRQYSIPHAVAMILLGMPISTWLDDEHDRNEAVQELRERVIVEHWDDADCYLDHIVKGQLRNMPARATVIMRDGKHFEAETEFALGDPWTSRTAYGDGDVIKKFRSISGLSSRRADEVIEAALGIEQLRDVHGLTRLLRVS